MGEGHLAGPCDDLFDQRALRLIAQIGHQATGEDGGVEEGLHNAGAAQLFENHGDVKALTAEAAFVFCEERADHAKFGQLGPDLGRHAAVAVDDLVAGGGIVFLAQEPAEGVLQHLPFFGQIEVHLRLLRSW